MVFSPFLPLSPSRARCSPLDHLRWHRLPRPCAQSQTLAGNGAFANGSTGEVVCKTARGSVLLPLGLHALKVCNTHKHASAAHSNAPFALAGGRARARVRSNRHTRDAHVCV